MSAVSLDGSRCVCASDSRGVRLRRLHQTRTTPCLSGLVLSALVPFLAELRQLHECCTLYRRFDWHSLLRGKRWLHECLQRRDYLCSVSTYVRIRIGLRGACPSYIPPSRHSSSQKYLRLCFSHESPIKDPHISPIWRRRLQSS